MEARLQLPLREITFKLANEKDYVMREMAGYEDLVYEHEFTEPDGRVNMERLWFRRLNVTIKSPPLTEFDYKQLSRGELLALQMHWVTLNQAVPDFLPTEKKDGSTSLTSTAPSSAESSPANTKS